MSASNEYTDYYLTPRGWVLGGEKLDFVKYKMKNDKPEDSVLERTYHEYMGSASSSMSRYYDDSKLSINEELIKKLLEKYPHPEEEYFWNDKEKTK